MPHPRRTPLPRDVIPPCPAEDPPAPLLPRSSRCSVPSDHKTNVFSQNITIYTVYSLALTYKKFRSTTLHFAKRTVRYGENIFRRSGQATRNFNRASDSKLRVSDFCDCSKTIVTLRHVLFTSVSLITSAIEVPRVATNVRRRAHLLTQDVD